MPDRLLAFFENQNDPYNQAPYFIINNIPLDQNIYGSPLSSEASTTFKSGCVSENILCAIGCALGEPYSISFEGRELVNNLTAEKNHKLEYTGLGSEVELDFHIENAALKHTFEDDCSPKGLLLLGIRDEPASSGPYTYVSDARKALELLSNNDKNILRDNNYAIEVPYRWRNAITSDKLPRCDVPIVSGTAELPRISAVFYPGMVTPRNKQAENAYINLYRAVKAVSIGVKIQPGRLVYVNNRFALHARQKFTATYDENGRGYRWIQRLFVTADLWAFRGFRSNQNTSSRVFNPVTTEQQ